MIVKIQPPHPGLMAAVRYNESKMNGESLPQDHDAKDLAAIEDGYVLATRNVPDGSSLTKEFSKLETLNLKTNRSGPKITNTAFHMSVNPSEDDASLPDEKAVELIDNIMESLGYGKQPYRIYKHTDIERMHYHVVSSRCGQDGKKITDSFERLKLRRHLKEISEKYGFEIILNENEKEKENKKEKGKSNNEDNQETAKNVQKPDSGKNKKDSGTAAKKEFVPPFTRESKEPVTSQFRNIVEDAMKWHFSTFEQLQNLMFRRYNVLMEIERNDGEGKVVMAGTDKKGVTITPFVSEKDLGLKLLEEIKRKTEKEKMRNRKEQRQRLESLAKAAAQSSDSFEEFLKVMEKKGVWVILSWAEEADAPFGVTYLDRATKCAWKGSETAVDISWLKNTASNRGWKLEKDTKENYLRHRRKLASRTTLKTVQETNAASSASGQKRPVPKRFVAGYQQGSNEDVSRRKSDLDENKRDDNVEKKYIGE